MRPSDHTINAKRERAVIQREGPAEDHRRDSTRPVISVCIANFNGIDLIDGCIASVRAQQRAEQIELIVHDDASTDGSAQHIRQMHPDVKLIASDTNVGFCTANNRMADIASGSYLLLLNNDAELLPEALQTLHTEASRLKRDAVLTLPQFDFETEALIDRGCLLDPFFNPVPNLDAKRQDVAMVIGACLWISSDLWHELGGFPHWFGSIAEDQYLCCQARLMGYPVRACTSSGYRHRVGYSFGGGKPRGHRLSTTYRRRALSERNKTYVLIATSPPPMFHMLLPLHLALLVFEGLAISLIRCDSSTWRMIYQACLRDLWQHRRHLFEMRFIVQAKRRTKLRHFYQGFDWRPYKLGMLLKHGLPDLH